MEEDRVERLDGDMANFSTSHGFVGARSLSAAVGS
jgi:hypothetical protein